MTESFTDIHGLSKFEDLDTPTAAKLNANWDKSDANMVKAATAFPSTFPLNKILMRTDLQVLYLNTGTVNVPIWTALSGGSSPMLLKEFFEEHDWLPAGTYKEELLSMPAFDFQVLTASTLTSGDSFARLSGADNPGIVGWDLGASYTKVLFIVGGVRASANAIGVTLFDSIPVDAGLTGTKAVAHLARLIGGGDSRIILDDNGATSDLYVNPDISLTMGANLGYAQAMAIYYDCVAHIVKIFVRVGSECWWENGSVSDSNLASIRAVGFMQFNGVQQLTAPIGIYVE